MEDTEMLTKKEILRRLAEENVYLGPKPERVFVYYIEKGLLSKSVGRNDQWQGLYPKDTVELIKTIKEYQKKGWKLSKIKEFLEEDKRQETIADKLENLRKWENQEARGNKLREMLQLPEGQAHDFYDLSRQNEDLWYWIVVVPQFEKITWFLIDISNPGNEQVVKKKIMTIAEYNTFIQTLATTQIEKGNILSREHIFEKAFSMYFS
jgi:DNA-binding transcriptional MerR regulator